MATIALQPCDSVKTSSGGAEEYDKIALTSGTPIAGDLMVKANAEVTICSTDPAVISYLTQIPSGGQVPGETKYLMQRIKPTETYVMNAYSSTSSLAVIADTALDGQSNYAIVKATNGGVTAWCIDIDDTGADHVRVRLINRLSGATDIFPLCEVQFLSSVLTFA